MWYTSGTNISMAEGDFGIDLPITVSGTTFVASDSLKLTIKDVLNGSVIIEKDFSNIQQNTITLTLSSSESALLPVGKYVYSLDWYQSGQFLCNIIPISILKVVEKA